MLKIEVTINLNVKVSVNLTSIVLAYTIDISMCKLQTIKKRGKEGGLGA